jgi:hypothetical protein
MIVVLVTGYRRNNRMCGDGLIIATNNRDVIVRPIFGTACGFECFMSQVTLSAVMFLVSCL